MSSQRLYLDVEEETMGHTGFFSLVPPTPEQQLATERLHDSAGLTVPFLRTRRSVSSDISTASDRWQTERSTSPSEYSVSDGCADSVDPSSLKIQHAEPFSNGKAAKGKKKASHARKQHPEHIPRPRNAFILFRKHVVDSQLIPPSVEVKHQNISVVVAKMWAEAPIEEKERFQEAARVEKEEHLVKYPGYRYQPVYRRTNVIRRRVKKDVAEEEKCSSMAELLIQGKVGTELEKEILEKTVGGPESGSDKSSGPGSRRGSTVIAACELSKGALRALRAQARQQSQQAATDWGDISTWKDVPKKVPRRSTSISHSRNVSEHSLFVPSDNAPSSVPSVSRAPVYSYPEQIAPHRYYSMDTYVDMPPQQRHQTWAVPMPEPMWDGGYPSPEPIFSSQQGMAFGEAHDLANLTIPGSHQQQQFDQMDNAYNQPSGPFLDVALSEYYTFDHALPFSPTGATGPGDIVADGFQAGIPPAVAMSAPSDSAFDSLLFDDEFMRDYGEAVVHSDVAWA